MRNFFAPKECITKQIQCAFRFFCVILKAKLPLGPFGFRQRYCFEEKTAIKEDENGKIRSEAVPHMWRAELKACKFGSLVVEKTKRERSRT